MQVFEFFSDYKPQPDGSLKEIDMVRYGPTGGAGRCETVAKISEISKLQPRHLADEGNIAVGIAWQRWDYIKPLYEAWKSGQKVPEKGTPLAAWSGLNPRQAEALKSLGILSLEEFVEASDGILRRLPFPNPRALQEAAALFLKSADRAAMVADSKAKDEQIRALQDQMNEMAELLRAQAAMEAGEDAPKRRGRPPKAAEEAPL